MPAPDDPRKPDDPTDLTKRSWAYVLRKTVREFSSDGCLDLAAALVYFGVLALFPGLVAIISLVGVLGQGPQTTQTLTEVIGGFAPRDVTDQISGVISDLQESQAAGIGLVVGLLGALWSASGYVGAFSRAMNRIYGTTEGRPVWKLRPMQLLVTVIAVVLVVAALVILVVSGPVAESIGDVVGLGSTAVTVWSIAKWPVLALIVVVVVAVLYQLTPNVRRPKWTWTSVGAVVAILVWALASAGFGFYVSGFSNYNKTYGSFAAVIVFLLWLWITNLALLFGAELDAELERGRQLQAGIAAEEQLQLPPRDTRKSDKAAAKHAEDVEAGRELRLAHGAPEPSEGDDGARHGGGGGSHGRDGSKPTDRLAERDAAVRRAGGTPV
ncbi:YihY/virulence factor BrkB family protein [Quadrisphaera sp. INWT6]|uniref:YihY/virulence factor BrkB family protein n=1 Tax=Quadrisphaera sp. INWT6 TaxID=2596917 RepID=UPI00189217BA|nr:YihY/virulence factor BrkB family protein [Quadrisphaera sp. INWT6]MBF5083015.1 YihY/virulence factor BrkB family protein [Quadrisphaera sp. INWT6]